MRVHVVDGNGGSVRDAKVTSGRLGECVTDRIGTCVIEDLALHASLVRVTHPKLGFAIDVPVTIVAGETTATARLAPGTTRTGKVTWAEDGTPAAGLDVFTDERATRTNAEGRYTLQTATPDERITAAPPLVIGETNIYERTIWAWADPRGNFEVHRQGETIRGVVHRTDGQPAAFASVARERESDGAISPELYEAMTFTNADGSFTLSNLGAEPFAVWATAPGHARTLLRNIAAGATVDLQIDPPHTFDGTAVDEAGAPLRTFAAEISPDYDEVLGKDGRFHFGDLAADGAHSVTIYATAPDGAALIGEGDGKAPIVAHRAATVRGRLVLW